MKTHSSFSPIDSDESTHTCKQHNACVWEIRKQLEGTRQKWSCGNGMEEKKNSMRGLSSRGGGTVDNSSKGSGQRQHSISDFPTCRRHFVAQIGVPTHTVIRVNFLCVFFSLEMIHAN